MKNVLNILFGAKAQVVVGCIFIIVTIIQTIYWLVITPPTVKAVFIVSMEALFFAGYAVVATGLGYRATERVETAVVENIENADSVTVDN